jgi:hypothetical protein
VNERGNATNGSHKIRPRHPWDRSAISSVSASDDHANSAARVGPTSGTMVVGASEYRSAATVRGLSATTAVASMSPAAAVSPDALSFKETDIYGMKELPVRW